MTSRRRLPQSSDTGRVVVTGVGCISPLGDDVKSSWDHLVAGRSASEPVTVAVGGRVEAEGTSVVAAVKSDPVSLLAPIFGRRAVLGVDRFSNFAAVATAEAVRDAGLDAGGPELRDAAVVYGAASGGLVSIEAAYDRMYAQGHREPHPLTVPRLMVSAPASHLSILFGVQGPCWSISSACASSAHAIAEGLHMIRSGRARRVIVGGADASLTYGGLQAWKALQALSDHACRPFSAGRDGTILGEGAATLVLEEEAAALERGARPYCVLAGAGATADAAHMTRPDEERAAAAIRLAHRDAELSTEEPLLISAHGTGTVLNDAAEASALRAAYGAGLARSRVIATKSAHGHMLGASGAMEFLVAILALNRRMAPPTQNFLSPAAECQIPLVLECEPIDYRAVMSASFAFGGLNAALIGILPDDAPRAS
jgi:nodulation protein E